MKLRLESMLTAISPCALIFLSLISRFLKSIYPDLPQTAGWLAHWQLIVAVTATFNSLQNFVTLKLTRKLYSGVPPTNGMTRLSIFAFTYMIILQSPLFRHALLLPGHSRQLLYVPMPRIIFMTKRTLRTFLTGSEYLLFA